MANLWRTTHDIAPTWLSIAGIIESQVNLHPYAGPGAWNDPDMLQVGNGSLTIHENRAHIGMWGMLAAPMFAGTDVPDLDPEILDALTNPDLVAISQDPLGQQARRIVSNGDGTQVWAPHWWTASEPWRSTTRATPPGPSPPASKRWVHRGSTPCAPSGNRKGW